MIGFPFSSRAPACCDIGIKGSKQCSFTYSHRNVFGRNQKLNISLERGQIDSIFRINYTDPWIQGDDKRTSRTIMVQVYICTFFFLHSCVSYSSLVMGIYGAFLIRIQEHQGISSMVTNLVIPVLPLAVLLLV